MTDEIDDAVVEAALTTYWGVPYAGASEHPHYKYRMESMRAAIRAAVMAEREACAKLVDSYLSDYGKLIDQGKGEHCHPGYVRDDVWIAWNAKLLVLQEVLRDIRARGNGGEND